MYIANKFFDNNKTYIMGILNVTPDSFSDGGRFNNIDDALKRVDKMVCDGADIIDIGGESTRPGYEKISSDEEISRVVPIIQAIKADFDIPISCDTYKADVAEAALSVGADMINDIWGFKYDKDMAKAVKKYDASVCLMHNRTDCNYTNLIDDVKADLLESIAIAKSVGISDDKICIDPGIGFAKSLDDNLCITKNLVKLNELGYPILYGSSRKSMIGLTLNLPVNERLEGTIATSVIACMQGACIIRVHDVKENKRAVEMTRAIIGNNTY